MLQATREKVIKSGDYLEYYSYQHRLFYGGQGRSAPHRRPVKSLTVSSAEKEKRRIDSLRRTQNKVRRLINANIQKDFMPIFLTYTFADNITDTKIANQYYKKHIHALKHKVPNLKYLTIIEFQKRGAVHYHTIYFNLPYISHIKHKLKKIWPHGFIYVKATANIKALGSYISKYLQKDFFDSRLVGQKAYLSSNNLLRPQIHYDLSTPEGLDIRHTLDNIKAKVERVYHSAKYGIIQYKLIDQKNLCIP